MTFSKEVEGWLRGRAESRPGFIVEAEVSLRGRSGGMHRIDFTISKRGPYLDPEELRVMEGPEPKMLVEVKAFGEGGSKHATTYRTHLRLAYSLLADFPKEVPKFVVVPRKLVRKRAWSFDFGAYFESIGARLIDFSKDEDRAIMEETVSLLH